MLASHKFTEAGAEKYSKNAEHLQYITLQTVPELLPRDTKEN
jgi:hypothetical protein